MRTALRKITSNLHYACTAVLAILAIPEIHRLHLPSSLDWRGNVAFYLSLGSQSLLYAMLFCALAFPPHRSLGPFLARYRTAKLRIVLAVVFLLVLLRVLPFAAAILAAAKTLFVIELAERSRSEGTSFIRKASRLLLPAIYMFVGLTLAIIYNDIIVADRFPLSFDGFLNRVDASFLWGRTISSIAHSLWAILPARFLSFLDIAYFQMFAIVGAGLLASAYGSFKRGMQFVGACLTAYYLSLLIFYIWPTYGPYVFCSTHAAHAPAYLMAYKFQASGMQSLQAVSQHKQKYLASGYYIAFPALHVGLPVIAMGMLRRCRGVFWFLAAYNLVLVVAIMSLEWHYVIDLFGGVAMGLLALAIVGAGSTDAENHGVDAKLKGSEAGRSEVALASRSHRE